MPVPLGCSTAGRSAASAVLPCRLYATGTRGGDGVSEQGGRDTILFKAAAETLRTIAADAKHLGAEIGLLAVLHTWGQNLHHHPHVHCVVPGGGPSLDGTRWVGCRPGFFLPIRVLSRLFRRLFLDALRAAFEVGGLKFFGDLAGLAEPDAFTAKLRAVRQIEWVVYSKPPFGGPAQVLAYLSRYTYRVAVASSRITEITAQSVSFRWKDYRHHGKTKVMTLDANEFIRRFSSIPCPMPSIASATTGSSPTGSAPPNRSMPGAAGRTVTRTPNHSRCRGHRFAGRAAVIHLPLLRRHNDHACGNLRPTPVAASNLERHLMNSLYPGNNNLIWQSGDMRAAGRRCFVKAGVTPFSQRSQRHLTLEAHAYNDRQDTTHHQQTKRTKIAATPSAKISSQALAECNSPP